MADAAQKSAAKASTASAERRPLRRAALAPEIAPALDAMYALQRDAGNRAVTQRLRGGAPLDPSVRAEMEARFGADFSAVRVHDDAQAHDEAALLDAKAYTHGNDIVFNADRYAPHSSEGRRLLSHEL
ncbi:MAG: DUF4157 domain-containing protein, partial [Sulfurifustaceae bacterium]